MTTLLRGGLRPAGLALLVALSLPGCDRPDPELLPDDVLRSELGLTDEDRVHTVRVSTGAAERADPPSVSVRPGDYVQFVTADRLVHEVAFVLDSIGGPGRAFLVRTGQSASPPMLELDARFVVSFVGAPEGRYPYALSGNRAPGSGAVVVEAESR